ncbi:hypothetical protein Tco_0782661 [Tanacetum coccineum]
MDSENYKEGQSMQKPHLFEANCFIHGKNRFETYVMSKDIDIWHVIVYGDYKPTIKNKDTVKEDKIPYEKLEETHKKMLSKNDEAKMILYNALPKREYERIFMCKTAKDVWNSLIITHQDTVMSDSDELGVTHSEISSPFEDLSDIDLPPSRGLPKEDERRGPEEDPVDYPVDGGDDGDDEDESSEDDEDDDEVDIEARR